MKAKRQKTLYPGDVRVLDHIAKTINMQRNILEVELDRLQKMMSNPSFPWDAYQRDLELVKRYAEWTAHQTAEALDKIAHGSAGETRGSTLNADSKGATP